MKSLVAGSGICIFESHSGDSSPVLGDNRWAEVVESTEEV